MSQSWITATLAAALLVVAAPRAADAQTKVRVGKAQAQAFAFVPADVGVETGIFKKHGIELETSAFGGDARMLQALTADGIDIALGGGPTLANIVKGHADAGRRRTCERARYHHAGGAQRRPGEDRRRSQGPHRERLDRRLLTYWLAQELSRSKGWGQGRHQDRPARHRDRAGGRAQDQTDRRRGRPRPRPYSRWKRKAWGASWCGSAIASRTSMSRRSSPARP